MTDKKILITYATYTGSTVEVAQFLGEELGKLGAQVDIAPLDSVTSLDPYAGVVIGAPMIMGWHQEAVRFIKKHQQALSKLPVAYFIMAMSLTRTSEQNINGVPVFVDPGLAKSAKVEGRLSFKERYATVSRYLEPALKAALSVKPISVGFFGGRLDMSKLKLLPMLFVMLVIQAQPGEKRNWPVIREWATVIYPILMGEKQE
jgi:menaquinone-dependent protoporphyrinogen oxidase